MPVTRRSFLEYFGALGLGATAFPESLWSQVQATHGDAVALAAPPALQDPVVTPAMIEAAEKLAGLSFTKAERELMVEGLNQFLRQYQQIRAVPIPNEVAPALRFDPLPADARPPDGPAGVRRRRRILARPPEAELAFLPVTDLAELVRTRAVSSMELTELYLDRLRRHGPRLECVITLTEDRAKRQARLADAEIARGRYRGPLHGIPWGAKDLLAVQGYRTTWGAKPYEQQVLEDDATVVRKLDAAGAVLVAKLTLGALAWGDVWYGGKTRNPWNPEEGSSGSSAGPAAATVAGLVGFSIGSETWGSIVSPSTRCGASGLRPTFGRVSRAGAMALSWSMDKLGPICRSAEDCALVLEAIQGPDGKDATVRDIPFGWDTGDDVRRLRVGYLRGAFEADHTTKALDDAALGVLDGLGVDPAPVAFPTDIPAGAISFILSAEAAAAFDDLTRSNRDDLLVRQIANAWPNVFRQSRFIPAVEYIQANRLRTMLMDVTERAMADLDVLVTPSFGGDILLRTNLTGHPAVVVPSGFSGGAPATSLSFIGRPYGEAAALTAAAAFQRATGFHARRPPLFVE